MMRKQELRHDAFRESLVKGVQYINDNIRTVIKIFIVIVLTVAVTSYYNHLRSIKVESAAHLAGRAQNIFINGNLDEALVKFERVLDDYPDTPGAIQSLIYLLNDALSQENYDIMLNLILEYNGNIDSINDPIVKSTIYKIQGDLALIDGNSDDAKSYYRKAEKTSQGSANQVKYRLDVISTLIIQKYYSEAQNILEDIIGIEDLGYNEKNKAEELLAFVNYKLGT